MKLYFYKFQTYLYCARTFKVFSFKNRNVDNTLVIIQISKQKDIEKIAKITIS